MQATETLKTSDSLTQSPSKAWRFLRVLLIIVLLFMVGATSLSGLWYVNYQQNTAAPLPTALEAMQSDDLVTVERGRWITFTPTASQPTTGLIFYPGGRVDERAYAPAMRALAEEGTFVVLVSMPLELPILDEDRALEVIEAYPEIDTWVMAGHSMGARSAATFVHDYPDLIDGLVLWAGFPPRDATITTYNGVITAITATEDGYVHARRVGWYSDRVPTSTEFVSIVGGNHAQFGYYVVEDMGRDGIATISRDEQQTQIVAATLALLERLEQ